MQKVTPYWVALIEYVPGGKSAGTSKGTLEALPPLGVTCPTGVSVLPRPHLSVTASATGAFVEKPARATLPVEPWAKVGKARLLDPVLPEETSAVGTTLLDKVPTMLLSTLSEAADMPMPLMVWVVMYSAALVSKVRSVDVTPAKASWREAGL